MSPLVLVLAAALPAPDAHSLANPAEVRPTHIALDLTVGFADKTLRGEALLTLEYPQGEEKASQLDLDTRELRIEAVTDETTGQPLTFTLEAPVKLLGQRLRIALPPRRPAQVRVAYRTVPEATALQWLEPRQTTSGKLPFLFTQSQSIHARSWVPCMDSPGVRLTYEAVIRVPPGTTAVMAAEAGTHQADQGIFRFKMPQPIPPYLFALSAGEIAKKDVGPRTAVYAEPAVLEKAAWEFAEMEKMVEAAERLYGPYAWGRWDVLVLPPSFPFGGMENPRLTFATPTLIAGDRSLTNVMAHELAHSWSGNLVTNATWSDFWLNEGFTSYIENRLVEEIYGAEVARMAALLSQRELRETIANPKTVKARTVMYRNTAGEDSDDYESAIVYDKGAAFLLMLETHFGRPAFDAFLRGYFEQNKFQSMTTPRFLEILKRDLFKGDAAAWKKLKVDEWISAPGLPSNLVAPRSQRFDLTKAAAAAFAKDGSLAGVKKDWVTAEWLDFLANLPKTMTVAQMKVLDDAFGFTGTGNAEILAAWLLHGVNNTYEPALPAVEDFLTRMGRRKFLRPLYQALYDNEKTRARGAELYKRARPGYHPIATATIDAIYKP
jgi:leukotriene-A4 hydrolase